MTPNDLKMTFRGPVENPVKFQRKFIFSRFVKECKLGCCAKCRLERLYFAQNIIVIEQDVLFSTRRF